MWSNFFRDGGFGMYPTVVFGFLLVAVSVQYLLRPEQRRLPLLAFLDLLTLTSGLLGTATGMVNSLRYIQNVEAGEQLKLGALGIAESLNNLVLAGILIIVGGLLAAIGAVRASRGATASPPSG